MLNVCETCQSAIAALGYPFSSIINFVRVFTDHAEPILIFDRSKKNKDEKRFHQVMREAEKKGYLVSTEVSHKVILLKLNTSRALYCRNEHKICWCRRCGE